MKYFSDKNYIYYPNTNAPINKLGIKNAEEIEELETQLFLKTYEYFHKPLNGRTIRLFFDMIAIYNGYGYISYENIGNRKNNNFIQASKYCMGGDCKPMEKIILKGLKSKP